MLTSYIALGNILDEIKKHVFYGRNIDYSKCSTNVSKVTETMLALSSGSHFEQDTTTLNVDPRLFHVILGIATESTELCEALMSVVSDKKELDSVNVQEELFDVMWYVLIGHDVLNKSLDETLSMGFDKLRARFPTKFEGELAIKRDTDIERKVMEYHQK